MKKALSKDGTLIAFDQSGQGHALILVTGAIARRTDAARLAASLSPHFTVFSYDRRGRGESGDTLPYAVEREVEDLDALITWPWRQPACSPPGSQNWRCTSRRSSLTIVVPLYRKVARDTSRIWSRRVAGVRQSNTS